MDARTDSGEYYPDARTGTVSEETLRNKVDRVTVGELGESYTLKDVAAKVNRIARALAPAVACLALCARAATCVLDDLPNTARVVTNEEDAVALAAVGALGAAVSNRVEELEAATARNLASATNELCSVLGDSIAEVTNAVDATYAKRTEIPAMPDLSPYALKSEIPTDYVEASALTGMATRAWIEAQGYASAAEVAFLTNRVVDATNALAQAATRYTDDATNALAQALGPGGGGSGGPAARLDDGTNIVTAAREVFEVVQTNRFSDWTWTSEPESGVGISNIRWEPWAEPDTYILFFDAVTDSGHGGPDYSVTGPGNSTTRYYVGDFGDSDVGIGWTITFRRSIVPVTETNYVGRLALTNELPKAGAEWAVGTTDGVICWTNGMIDVSLPHDDLQAVTNGWPDGASVFVRLRAAAQYIVHPPLRLVGYAAWPTNEAEAVAWRSGTNVFVNVIRIGE